MSGLSELFSALWSDYAAITPQAQAISALLAGRGDHVHNDHIALRTFGLEGVDIEDLDRAFVGAGYEPIEHYEFPNKKLDACHYEHPRVGMPKVFISSLRVDELSEAAGVAIRKLVTQLPPGAAAEPHFVVSGRRWSLDVATYRALLAESEYAAWVAAFGFRANHFTVLVNALESFSGLAELNEFLVGNGFKLNESGGAIKGSPEQLLEQSSTLADRVTMELDDGEIEIPSCYYEFARRYPKNDGELFSGFIASSADKIFESTHTR